MTVLENYLPLIWWGFIGLLILLVISFIMIFVMLRRLKRFQSSYIALQTFMSGQELDTLLESNIQKIDEQEQKIAHSLDRISSIEQKLRASVDHAELLRFKAFENVGSDLSFALALLNQEGSGVVLTSIHTREESRVYAKPVEKWESSYVLSEEEKEVIKKAGKCYKI